MGKKLFSYFFSKQSQRFETKPTLEGLIENQVIVVNHSMSHRIFSQGHRGLYPVASRPAAQAKGRRHWYQIVIKTHINKTIEKQLIEPRADK